MLQGPSGRAGWAGWQADDGSGLTRKGIPSCCSVGGVPAGPSWSKHLQALSRVGAPLLPKHQVSPPEVWRLLVITPACRPREAPGISGYPGTYCGARVPRNSGQQDREIGTSASAAEQLGLQVPATKAVKKKAVGTPVPALRRRRRSSGPDRRDKLQCQQTNIPSRHPSSNPATVNHLHVEPSSTQHTAAGRPRTSEPLCLVRHREGGD